VRSLRDSVVAVTGASAGIGRECALAFAREGAKVVVGARRRDRLDELVAEIERAGGHAMARAMDVGEEHDVQRFVDAAAARFGRLDVLVNNAGYGIHGRVEETPGAAFERLMRVNYLGTVHGCRAALPIMKRQGSGVIVNISSIVGHRALPGGAAYAATKAAQISLTESLRVELRGTGIHVCSVHPISTVTEFHEVLSRESSGQVRPMGPRQSAAAVARAVVGCAKRPRPEVYPYPASRLIVWLNALSPRLADWVAYQGARRAGRL
jgi:NAD(P)-dependent dehydrogenase (short-subunit alcohol dehydrogenase family)